MVEIINVTKRFYSLTAIDQVSLKVPKGEVVGLLGPNGAGKTTLLKLIAGLLNPDTGRILPITGYWPAIGYKPERLLFPNQLRVTQYLELVAGLSNTARSDIEKVVFESLARVDLLEAAGKKIKDCSKGMRQRLGLAQALIGNPPLLLLDEPSNGLDPEGQSDMHRCLRELHADGKTILMSSHQLQEVTEVCTHLVILNRGQVHYQNNMVDALTVRPHTIIHADKDLSPLRESLQTLHPDIQVEDNTVILRNEAMAWRRQILTAVLQAGFDVIQVEQKNVTLAEIYAGVVH
ncbi:MAG TPA: ABC transporter ATP-binding protein [Anaerolineae bacterium]